MTSRRKSKRSVSLRSSSFIRLISPFRSKNIAEQGAVAGEGGEGRQLGSVLGAAFSDSQLNVSCKSTGDSWGVNVDRSPGGQNTVRQTPQSPHCQSLGTSRLSMSSTEPGGGGAGSGDLNISQLQCNAGLGLGLLGISSIVIPLGVRGVAATNN